MTGPSDDPPQPSSPSTDEGSPSDNTAATPSADRAPIGVFVYGTLKHDRRNFTVAVREGCMMTSPGIVYGFDLYDLIHGYPAAIPTEDGAADRGVIGELLEFDDLDAALVRIDEFEGEGWLYERIPVDVMPLDGWRHSLKTLAEGGDEPSGDADEPSGETFQTDVPPEGMRAWMYVFPGPVEVAEADGRVCPSGRWPDPAVPRSLHWAKLAAGDESDDASEDSGELE